MIKRFLDYLLFAIVAPIKLVELFFTYVVMNVLRLIGWPFKKISQVLCVLGDISFQRQVLNEIDNRVDSGKDVSEVMKGVQEKAQTIFAPHRPIDKDYSYPLRTGEIKFAILVVMFWAIPVMLLIPYVK